MNMTGTHLKGGPPGPVNRGLVEKQEDWIWSSYNWYQGQTDVPLKMDLSEF